MEIGTYQKSLKILIVKKWIGTYDEKIFKWEPLQKNVLLEVLYQFLVYAIKEHKQETDEHILKLSNLMQL